MKNMILPLAMVLSFATNASETVINFKCTEIGVPQIFQFKMEGSVRSWSNPVDSPEQKLWRVEGLKADIRESGFASTFRTVDFGRMKGELKYINNPDWTLEPFTSISLKPASQNTDKEVASAQFNLDYPGKLSSKLRLKDGKTFKAKCETVKVKTCIFGDTIGDNENDFDSKELEILYTDSRIEENSADFTPGQTIHVEKTRLTHKATGRTFLQFTTFEDEWDGGNTIGWIEDANGKHVANIGDSDIYDCQAFK
jgi:hypothetical protein